MANIPFLNNAYFSAKVGIGTETPGGKLDVKDGNSLSENKEGSGKENGGSGGEQNVVKKAKKIDKKKSLRRL